MASTRSLADCLQHLGRTLAVRELCEESDTELVGRFARNRDEAAFTALVRRYGHVVLGVCQRVLRQEQDAEDAFQAAFLVLARDAASVRQGGAVGSYLYGVAFNVARKARTMRQRREAKEREAAARQRCDAPAVAADDLRQILDGELLALPERYRTPVILCDLRGLTIREAAAEAGCPPKTLGTRLTRGRAMLARRLARRGVAVCAGALAAALAPSATAEVLPRLIGSTVKAATGPAAVSPAVKALMQGVSKVMLPRMIKVAAGLACGVLLLAGLAGGSLARPSEPTPQVVAANDDVPAPAVPPEVLAGKRAKHDRAARLHAHLHDVLSQLVFPLVSRHLLTHSLINLGSEAEDKVALKGAWTRKGANLKIDFTAKDVMKISAHDGDLVVSCEYALKKDGLVEAKITSLTGKEELTDKAKEILPVGLAFRFIWKVKDGTATLDDLKGDKTDTLKSHLEGEYGPKE